MLKHIKILKKVLRHVSILTDYHQGVGLYLVKVTELFKNLKHIKILKKALRHISILADHHQGVGLYLVKVTELFKNLKKH